MLKLTTQQKITKIQGQHSTGRSNHDVGTVKIESSNILFMPNGIGEHFSKLQRLQIDNDQLTGISKENFVGLKMLKELFMTNNKLQTIPGDAFNDLSNLELLDLQDNMIEILDTATFSQLQSLKRLNLGHNKLTSLPSNLFKGNVYLQEILMGRNDLKALSIEAFDNLSHLKNLDMTNNICIDAHFQSDNMTLLNTALTKCMTVYSDVYVNYEVQQEAKIEGDGSKCTYGSTEIVHIVDHWIFRMFFGNWKF